MIREARAEDADAMLAIYAPYIRDTSVTFETEVPTREEFARRIASITPWLVEEREGRVVGYAYASKHRERAAYQWCVEVSAYVAPTARRGGVARALYEDLFVRLRKKGLVNAYAGITLPNEASVRFHEALGFRKIGVYERIGFKLGAWHDVGWWALRLQEPAM